MAIWFKTHLRRFSVRPKNFQRVTQSILVYAGYPTAELSVSLVGTTRMRSLNRTYRNRDYPTDVLAFPMESPRGPTAIFLGDVVLCLPVAIRQASRFNNTPDQEILRLLIHGILHLLGYDHEKSREQAATDATKRTYNHQQTFTGASAFSLIENYRAYPLFSFVLIMSWIQRLQDGLAKTRQNVQSSLRRLVGGELDPAVIEDVEASLLQADVGVRTVQRFLDEVNSQTGTISIGYASRGSSYSSP